MNYTERLMLLKPERGEQYNIDHWNANSEKIDEYARKETSERVSAVEKEAGERAKAVTDEMNERVAADKGEAKKREDEIARLEKKIKSTESSLSANIDAATMEFITVTSSTALDVGSNGYVYINAPKDTTILLNDAKKKGSLVYIFNTTSFDIILNCKNPNDNINSVIVPMSKTVIMWTGSQWVNFNAPPVESTYVQFPQQRSPSELFPCTKWTKLNFSGAFFRSEGGKANPFVNDGDNLVAQPYMVGPHVHIYYDMGDAYNDRDVRGGGSSTSHRFFDRVRITNSNGGTETRPENFTVRIWKRLA